MLNQKYWRRHPATCILMQADNKIICERLLLHPSEKRSAMAKTSHSHWRPSAEIVKAQILDALPGSAMCVRDVGCDARDCYTGIEQDCSPHPRSSC